MLSRVLRYTLKASKTIPSTTPLLSSRTLSTSLSYNFKKVSPSVFESQKEDSKSINDPDQDLKKSTENLIKDLTDPKISESKEFLVSKPSLKIRAKRWILLASKEEKEQIYAYKNQKHKDWQTTSDPENIDENEKERILQESTDAGIKDSLNRGMIVMSIILGMFATYYFYMFGWAMCTPYDCSKHPVSVFNRANYYSFEYMKEEYSKPKESTLLPPFPEVPKGYINMNPKYTFVFEPLKMLTHTEYDLTRHWSYKYRKGGRRLLEQTLQSTVAPVNDLRCETVIWTSQSDFENEWVHSLAAGRGTVLFRSSCDYTWGIESWSEMFTNLGFKAHYWGDFDRKKKKNA